MVEETQKTIPFRSILIYGMGMMGASLARALMKQESFRGKVTGIVRTENSAAFIRNNGLADSVLVLPDLAACAELDSSEYDLVVLGLPVRSIAKLIPAFPAFDCIVTDMSSTRREVHAQTTARADLRFVGSHPMCGSEDAGPSAFKEDLFQSRLCILTPGEGLDADDHKRRLDDAHVVESFWRALGMKTYFLDADSHDELLAYLSHAPHIVSSILTLWAQSNPIVYNSIRKAPMPITGGGFKDMARIAGSNPEMWTDILVSNRDNLISSLESFVRELEQVIGRLKENGRDEWPAWFASARKARNRLCWYSEDR